MGRLVVSWYHTLVGRVWMAAFIALFVMAIFFSLAESQ